VIKGLLFLNSRTGEDPRGVVREFYRHSSSTAINLPVPVAGWAQLNVTESHLGAVRGLHAEGTDKLVGIVSGQGFGAWVDARPGSSTFGEMVTATLEIGTQVYVPAGVLNGWQALSEPAQYLYCFSREWVVDMGGVFVTPLDSTLNIAWPISVDPDNRAQLSSKDEMAPDWETVRESLLQVLAIQETTDGNSSSSVAAGESP
jgi:dTDP-4-dehydrorhamnose 3,5-epimerase